MTATKRATVAEGWSADQPQGSLLIETCHRVEIYGSHSALARLAETAPDGVRPVAGRDVARHLVRLAVGRDSSVVGEDQVLHQLRLAAQSARLRWTVTRELDRLLDLALHAGRRARSWLPASRPTLVDVALERAIGLRGGHGARFHVVGTGEMGQLALANLLGRGATVTVASRTSESARALADRHAVGHAEFDPGHSAFAELAGIVVALAGPWTLSDGSADALVQSGAWVADLSSPPALGQDVAHALGARLSTIDDLAQVDPGAAPSNRLLERLDGLVEQTVAEYERWAADEARRAAAEALSNRAHSVRAAELERLWRRVPSLDDNQRAEVERAVEHLTDRLLRDPLEQLGQDGDGSHARAARDLFRL